MIKPCFLDISSGISISSLYTRIIRQRMSFQYYSIEKWVHPVMFIFVCFVFDDTCELVINPNFAVQTRVMIAYEVNLIIFCVTASFCWIWLW